MFLPANASVKQGETEKFKATCPVTWSITGNESNNTSISQDGILTIGEDETATNIEVRGSLTTMYKSANVTVRSSRAYTELEYIQSTGTQYIDTGYIFTSLIQKVELNFTPMLIGDYRVCGSYINSGGNHCGMIIQPRQTNMCEVGNKSVTTSFSISANTNYDVVLEANNGSLSFQVGTNSTTNSYTANTVLTGLTHYIFNVNYNGTPNPASMKLCSYKMYDNNVLVRDFIPARRNSDDAIGLWDKVTETFFTNRGTGTFIAGNPV